MRSLALGALALLLAGCSQPSATPEADRTIPVETAPWSVRIPLEGRAPGGEQAVHLGEDVQGLRVLVTLHGGVFTDLAFVGPGTCADGMDSPQGSAAFLPGTVLQLDGRLGTTPQRCGDVPRGTHALAWTLSTGNFSGEAILQGRVLAAA